ncbi:hypothetical protein [Limnoglobus roseus]|uniref:hypothetical protein n=1 Tax=Limnoglobus roseus TaxID=2598579 RepID=UPI0011EB9386|nr:hypothetical protein [Limnoglobus roseus]
MRSTRFFAGVEPHDRPGDERYTFPRLGTVPPTRLPGSVGAATGAYPVPSPDLKIVAVSGGDLRATVTRQQAILGRGEFEVFPDTNAGGVRFPARRPSLLPHARGSRTPLLTGECR